MTSFQISAPTQSFSSLGIHFPSKTNYPNHRGQGSELGVWAWTFILFLCSHHVSNVFSMLFLKFTTCSSRVLPIAAHFIPYGLPTVLPFSPI